jgi:hypothetical protein
MSTNRSVGRIASTQAKVRSVYIPKKDRSPNLCAFTFADGRQCRTPRCSGHLHLCYFHAQKEAERLAAQQVGEDISRFLPTKLLTACDLGVALSRTFCAVAQGQIKPKVATTLAYLAQTMLQSIPIAQDEYINSFDTNTWRTAVRASFRHEDEPNTSQSAPKPPTSSATAPTAMPASSPASQPPVNSHSDDVAQAGIYPDRVGRPEEPASSSNSSLAPHHSFTPSEAEGPLPQPPHTPLLPTITEFARQLLAGRNSCRSEIPSSSDIPPASAPARDPGSSASSSSTSTTPSQPGEL